MAKRFILIITVNLVFLCIVSYGQEIKNIKTGAEQTYIYLNKLQRKNIAVVANQTSVIGNSHLVDSLLKLGISIKKVFCPEHGFRGSQEAGETVQNFTDSKTKLPVISLYGKNKKPAAADLKGIDIVIFDIQDVGARFYTYISTLHYVMEACAENKVKLIVLDRPNPNGSYVDGPVLDMKFSSFVGMHAVPIVHGMCIGEYALMINGEKWLPQGMQCRLEVIKIYNYSHSDYYSLPVKPSPNLPDMASVYLYPSLCLFEGTVVSVGRGTMHPFEMVGHPLLETNLFSFTPTAIKGMSSDPPYKDQKCYGYDLEKYGLNVARYENKLNLFWLLDLYKRLSPRTAFFTPFFDKLAGSDVLRKQIIAGKTEEEIRKSWEKDITAFKKIRKKYLLYPDFE